MRRLAPTRAFPATRTPEVDFLRVTTRGRQTALIEMTRREGLKNFILNDTTTTHRHDTELTKSRNAIHFI